MKLSFIFELLLIFILIAFAASAVIDFPDSRALHNSKRAINGKHGKITHKRQQDTANKYCSCSTKLCNCCREFNIPVVALQGPGCASLQYLKGDRLAISMSFGERVLTNTTISSKKPQPVCMPLPGGVTKFCGRVYNIGRKGGDFKACLGLELRSLKNVEAALRVSCFRFGPNGLKVEPSQPLPPVEEENEENEDEYEDEYDFDDDDDNDVDSIDYGTFSIFDDDFIGEYFTESPGGGTRRKPTLKPFIKTTTKAPVRKITTRKPTTTPKPAKTNEKKKQKPKTTIRPKSRRTTRLPLVTSAKLQSTESIQTTNSVTHRPFVTTTPIERVPSSANESISAVTVMPQAPQEESAAQSAAPSSIPLKANAAIDTPTETQTAHGVSEPSTNIITEQPIGLMSQEALVQEISEGTLSEKIETTTVIENSESATTTISTTPNDTSDEDDESDEEEIVNPIAEVVEEVIEEEVESGESTTTVRLPNDKDITNMNIGEKSDKNKDGVIDDIVDGMVDTLAEEEEGRSVRRRNIRRMKGRQSRDMWLARLHW